MAFPSLLSTSLIIIVLAIAYSIDYIRHHSKVSPVAFKFPSPSNSTIRRLTDRRLVRLDPVLDSVSILTDSNGAESFAEDPLTGDIYTGLADGRLQRLRLSLSLDNNIDVETTDVLRTNNTDVGDGKLCSSRQQFATCGRVLGLKVWHPKGENATLIACEVSRGLVMIENIDDDDSPHDIKLLTDRVDDNDKISLCNSAVVSADGSTVFFTDSSKRSLAEFIYDVLDGRQNGRLLSYDMKTKKTRILKDRIGFANGVAMTHESDALLVIETTRGIVWKYQMTGDVTDQWSIFSTFQFIPDNIQRSPDNETYLIGGVVWLNPFVKAFLSSWTFIRKALGVFSADQLLQSDLANLLSRDAGIIAVLNKTGDVTNIIDGTTGGVKGTTEGFETSKGILLWGGYRHADQLVVSRKIDFLIERDQEEKRKMAETKEREDNSSDFIDPSRYGGVVNELQLGDEFVDT